MTAVNPFLDPMPDPEAPILVTSSAANKVSELIAEEGNPDLKLRIYVSGGGCSGFQYGFAFEEVVGEGDTLVEKDGVSFLVDSVSLQYLAGAEIDYQEGLEGSRFIIKNPNAASSCSCGSSFSVASACGS
jgi:iron-sulfur cluster insertion protein